MTTPSGHVPGEVPAPGGTGKAAARLWGHGSIDGLFSSDLRVVPWPSAPASKGEPLVAHDDLRRLVAGTPALADLDPRRLFATQTWVVSGHVAYYLTPTWGRTGRTAADRHRPANRYPLIWVDAHGRHVILGGHHRSFAALVEGRPVRARILRPPGDDTTAVLPLLLVGTTTALPHTPTADPDTASALVLADRTALVPDLAIARTTLVALGHRTEIIEDRLSMATANRCLLAE